MTDVHTPVQRKRNMRAIKNKNTKPERIVRELLSGMGYRYRLNHKWLPGKPDIAFISRKKAILVHGCFWHCHDCKYGIVTPKQNADFWADKRQKSVERDRVKVGALSQLGFSVLVIWECELKDITRLESQLRKFLR